MTTIAVSLKSYLGASETHKWMTGVAAIARSHEGILDGRLRLIVLPSFPLISDGIGVLAGSGVEVGAQDVSPFGSGAVTGGVSAELLRELGCTVVELGHAERRRLFGEDDAAVASKLDAAVGQGLQPLLCVGEDEQMSAAGAALAVVAELRAVLAHTTSGKQSVVIAYEPRWAIGQALPASAEHIATVASALLEFVASDPGIEAQVIYGGSAGPGLLASIGGSVDGLFLGRFAHDLDVLRAVLDEALTVNDGA
jgi:triosephosphate isomerase